MKKMGVNLKFESRNDITQWCVMSKTKRECSVTGHSVSRILNREEGMPVFEEG